MADLSEPGATAKPAEPAEPAEPGTDLPPISLAGWILARPFIWLIRLYRLTLSPLLGNQCRFMPTCSAFGLEAYERHGPLRGTALTVWRILRCQPFVRGGFEPVPMRPTRSEARAALSPTTPDPAAADPPAPPRS